MHRLQRTSDSEEVRTWVLLDIQDKLERAGETLDTFNLPLPRDFNVDIVNNRDVQREMVYVGERERMEAAAQRAQMYPEQWAVFDEIARHAEEQLPGIFFVDGPGCCGEAFLYETLLHHARGQ